jgi:predicted acyltransferase
MASIDVFRGLTVACMIVVNTAGYADDSYAQLRHSLWNGCTLTDLVFPSFLFLMGVSMAFSVSAAEGKSHSTAARVLKATRRSGILVVIGLVLNALPHFSLANLRYCGVMQRIGVTYWLAALLLIVADTPTIAVICAALLVGYWALMTLVPVPGYGLNGIALGVLNPAGNLASALDRLVIPQAHIYHHTFYDPEGLLSTLPALASVLLGVLAGRLLRRRELPSRLAWMAACGAALAAAGYLWSTAFPMNKRMWTSSYALWAAGIDFLLLAWMSRALDRPGDGEGKRSEFLTPWLAFGSNALAAYVLSEVLATAINAIPAGGVSLQQWTFLLLPAWAGPLPMRSLEWSLAFTTVCFLPILYLYKKRILIKL